MKNKMEKQEKKTIKGFQLRILGNDLYLNFMRSVINFATEASPLELGISACYEKIRQAFSTAEKAKHPHAKHPLTKELDILNDKRKARFRCLKGHIWADLENEEPELCESARVLRNKIESYGDILRIGRRALSARLVDMGQDLSKPPFSEHVAKLGQTANLNAMIAANEACMTTANKREESMKHLVPNAFLDARIALDEAYRELVSAVNAQIEACRLVDGVNVANLAALEDFAKIINELIKSYRTTAKQSVPEKG